MKKHTCSIELPCKQCLNNERAIARYHRLKGDPEFRKQERQRDRKRQRHTCPDVLPCKQCAKNQLKRKYPGQASYPREKHPYKRTPRMYWRMVIGLLAQRDGWGCHLCHLPVTWETVTIDHKIPQVVDSTNHDAPNLALAHRICNAKQGRTLLQ